MDLAAHPFPGTERVKAFKGASDGESSADDVSGAIPHLSEDDSADMDSDDDAEIERLVSLVGSSSRRETHQAIVRRAWIYYSFRRRYRRCIFWRLS